MCFNTEKTGVKNILVKKGSTPVEFLKPDRKGIFGIKQRRDGFKTAIIIE